MQSQLGEKKAEVVREKKQRERLEVQCHELERELESIKRCGSRLSQNAESAKEVARYKYMPF